MGQKLWTQGSTQKYLKGWSKFTQKYLKGWSKFTQKYLKGWSKFTQKYLKDWWKFTLVLKLFIYFFFLEFIQLCYIILKLDKHICQSQQMLFVPTRATCFGNYWPSSFCVCVCMHFILSFKFQVFNAWRWSLVTETCSRCWRDEQHL